jgi:hypothetical protein
MYTFGTVTRELSWRSSQDTDVEASTPSLGTLATRKCLRRVRMIIPSEYGKLLHMIWDIHLAQPSTTQSRMVRAKVKPDNDGTVTAMALRLGHNADVTSAFRVLSPWTVPCFFLVVILQLHPHSLNIRHSQRSHHHKHN